MLKKTSVQICMCEIKVVTIRDSKGINWFQGKPIGNLLGYKNFRSYTRIPPNHRSRFDALIHTQKLYTVLPAHTIFVNNMGVYTMIKTSSTKESKKYKEWMKTHLQSRYLHVDNDLALMYVVSLPIDKTSDDSRALEGLVTDYLTEI